MGVKRESCDVHFSKAVRERDKHLCQFCGGEGTDCAHIYTRKNKRLRWAMSNALCLCRWHHQHFGENPIAFHDFLTGHFGQAHMDQLRADSQEVMKTNKALRLEISKHYREQLKLFYADPKHVIESWN